jgi:ParB family chromosome partitioning protein
MAEFRYTQADLAQILGRSRSHLANTLRLLQLPASIQTMVTEGTITAGHARALLAVKDPQATAKRIVEEGLNVRDVERIAHEDHGTTEPRQSRPRRTDKDPDTRAVEQALEDVLGLKVAIDHKGQGGELRIRYASLDQLDALCRRLKGSAAA